MPFDDVKIPIRPVAWPQYRSECLVRPLVYGDKPTGVAPATSTATSVWLATYGSGMEGDEWGLQRVFATKEEAYAYAFRPERSRHEDCHIEEWALGGDCLSHVATSPGQRHDESTCRSEKQVGPVPAADGTDWPTSGGGPTPLDVGEGWRWVQQGEILQDGDECLCPWSRDDENPWRGSYCVGMSVTAKDQNTYRRRVTPDRRSVQPEEQPLGACLDEENNELRQRVDTLTAEVERLKAENAKLETENDTLRMCKLQAKIDESKIITEEWAETLAQTTVENERLKAEVERLRRENALFRCGVELLTADVERLRLTEAEKELLQSLGYSAIVPDLYRTKVTAMIKRLGGGE